MSLIQLEPDNFYHIYNHSNGSENIFLSDENYTYFLVKYKEYITPIADTFVYCLMPNHFHFLLKIVDEKSLFDWLKENGKIGDDTIDLTGFKNLSGLDFNPFAAHISRQFSHFFNSYSKSINKQEKRFGSLFNRPFKRKQITSEKQFYDTTIYIHSNPVHHGFVENIEDWKHSSYHSILSEKPTILKREEVLNHFENKENFIYCHKNHTNILIEKIEEN